MMNRLLKSIKVLVLILFATAACWAVSGQASAEAAQPPLRGEGAGIISGYRVTDLRYLLAADPAHLSAVTFELDGPARQVEVSFDRSREGTFSCNNTSGNRWVCPLEEVDTGEVREILVSASG